MGFRQQLKTTHAVSAVKESTGAANYKMIKSRNGKEIDLSLTSFIVLITILNINVHATALVHRTKIQSLGGVESDVKAQKINIWNSGEHHLVEIIRRVKRYDKNAWKSWKPGDSDPWADTQADYERQYNRDRAENRRRQEANRRYNEEKAKSDAYLYEVANRRKNRTFLGPIIGVSCFVGLFVCCCCCGLCLKCSENKNRYNSQANNSQDHFIQQQQPMQATSSADNVNSTQTQEETCTTSGHSASPPPQTTAPLLPKKAPSAPNSEENNSELPPSYAEAITDAY